MTGILILIFILLFFFVVILYFLFQYLNGNLTIDKQEVVSENTYKRTYTNGTIVDVKYIVHKITYDSGRIKYKTYKFEC